MKKIIFILLLAMFCIGAKFKDRVYPALQPNLGMEFITQHSNVNTSFVEVINLEKSMLVFDHAMCSNSFDQDVVLRIGAAGSLEMTILANADFVIDNMEFPGKIYIKQRNANLSSGELLCNFW